MKIVKGCLIIITAFLVILVVLFFVYRNSVISSLENLSADAKSNWEAYIGTIDIRNQQLLRANIKEDSLRQYLNKSIEISKVEFSRDFEFLEYKINREAMNQNIKLEIEDKLNSSVDLYNQSVRSYNVHRSTFPNSLIARKLNFPKNFKYFDIVRYGVENENPTIKRAKIDHWIKYGDPHP
ncbi:MAG: LemA family protein [Flavobacterium sp.]|nr:LemA family protein [Flavobacterium sp.]